MLSYSFLTLDFKAPPSLTFFFLSRAVLRDFATTFLLFSNVSYISFLILLTLACGFYGFSFWWTNKYLTIFASIKVDWHVSFLSPLFSLTYLYHWSNSLHKVIYMIYAQSTFSPFFALINVMTFLLLKYVTFFFDKSQIWLQGIWQNMANPNSLHSTNLLQNLCV